MSTPARAKVEEILASLNEKTVLAGHIRNALKAAEDGDRVTVENVARGLRSCSTAFHNHGERQQRFVQMADAVQALSETISA